MVSSVSKPAVLKDFDTICALCSELDEECFGIDTLINTEFTTSECIVSDMLEFVSLLCSCDKTINPDILWNVLSPFCISSEVKSKILGILSRYFDNIAHLKKFAFAPDSVQVLVKVDMLKRYSDILYSVKLLDIYKYIGNEIVLADGFSSEISEYYYEEYIDMLKRYISIKLGISYNNI